MSTPRGAPVLVAVVAGTKTRIKVLEKLLNQPGLVVVGSAQDPVAAEQLVVNSRPAAILLDLDLWSGGLEAIERIMANRATPIVVIGPAAEHPEAAIAAGAVDVVGALDVAPGSAEYAHMVMRHLKIASRVRVITHPRGRLRGRGVRGPATQSPPPPPERVERESRRAESRRQQDNEATPERQVNGSAAPDRIRQHVTQRPRPVPRRQGPLIVAIGASTGGPPALATILSELPADLPAAVLVVQHMAEGFVEGLARWLDGVCPLPVVVAVDGERLQPGQVYLAPANQNMIVRPGCRVGLADPPPGQYHVPGVDVTFRSVAQVSGQYSVAALLTGMGRDGAAGLKVLRDIGAFTIGQDESTSVVWGMPAAAQEVDAVDLELPLPAISQAIVTAVQHAVDDVVEVGS
ncbi:MAG TPA: chemotaxis protein CheB [Actinomycetes bacterium]|nr:chemotaxis protein CheB [Actinomycetes bacterium]